jgi:hypothetical protein
VTKVTVNGEYAKIWKVFVAALKTLFCYSREVKKKKKIMKGLNQDIRYPCRNWQQ